MRYVKCSSVSNGVLVDKWGQPLVGHVIHVRDRDTGTDVPLFSDSVGTSLAQPVTTTSLGSVPGWFVSGNSINFYDATTGNTEPGDPISADDTTLLSRGTGALVMSGGAFDNNGDAQSVNTGLIFQSTGGANPLTQLNGFGASPFTYTGISTAGAFIDDASGTTWQLVSSITSLGTRPAIAIGALATGLHVWGFNPNVWIPATSASGGIAYGIEIDVGYLGTGTGSAIGMLISGQSHGGTGHNTGDALRITAQAASAFTNGIAFRSTAGQPASSSIIVADSGISAVLGVELAGAFSTAAFLASGATPTGLALTGSYTNAIDMSTSTVSAAGLKMGDDKSIHFGTTSGGALGAASTHKVGFWGATPVMRPGTSTQHVSCRTTIGVNGVNDAAIAASDLGKVISGTGIAASSQVTLVVPGVSFTMSNPATATGTVTLTFGNSLNTGAYTTGISTAVTVDGSFTGALGATKYTIGQVVTALKLIGVLAQ